MASEISINISEKLAKIASAAEFYRLRIAIENICTPIEFANIASEYGGQNRQVQEWISSIKLDMAKGNQIIRPYLRSQIGANMELYACGNSQSNSRNLLINFCGGYPFRPLAMPMSVFLQHIASEYYDVLNIRDPVGEFYLIDEKSESDALMKLIKKIELNFSHYYKNIYCCGLSSGAYATIVCGELLGAKKTLVFSGVHPLFARKKDNQFTSRLSKIFNNFHDILRRESKKSNVLLVYGSDNSKDKESALEFQRQFNESAIDLLQMLNVSTHLTPIALLKISKLKEFLNNFFLETRLANTNEYS